MNKNNIIYEVIMNWLSLWLFQEDKMMVEQVGSVSQELWMASEMNRSEDNPWNIS